MVTKKDDKYADYRYELDSETERLEVEWLISQGDFKDMEDFINHATKARINRWKREDAEKRRLEAEKKKRAAARRKRAAERKKLATTHKGQNAA